MKTMKPYKFLITPIVQIIDEKGEVIDEDLPDPFKYENGAPNPSRVFGCENLIKWAEEFPIFIEELNKRIAFSEVSENMNSEDKIDKNFNPEEPDNGDNSTED